MTPEEIDELERLMTEAPRLQMGFDDGITDDKTGEQGKPAALYDVGGDWIADFDCGMLPKPQADAIGRSLAALHNAAPALIAAARDLAWHEDRHGTRAEQEAEDAVLDADLARIDSLSDEECIAELAAEGIDYDAARKKFDAMLKVCAERSDLRREVERLRAFVPRWERVDKMGGLRLRLGALTLASIARNWDGLWYYRLEVERTDYPTADDAARAVCARLGIPDVEVPS